ncbi:hypothetical protein V9L20_02580 [Variovorax sp. CCNWLW225]|uniref:hypothetical protein n=1 Tax=Variovorax sp. CCNWLW225 TaxID=3127462 RepID=UPI0030778FD9
MPLIDQLHSGLDAGVKRHWRYAKEMFDIKPEYLMTIAVADALSDGYDNVNGLDVEIRLERPTHKAVYQVLEGFVTNKQWFAIRKDAVGSILRKGKVDVIATAAKQIHLVELKGFDPAKGQIKKEIERFQDFFGLNKGTNAVRGGHVVFPSKTSCEKRLKVYGSTLIMDPALTFEVICRKQVTGEDSQDGIPAYFTNSISITRRAGAASETTDK